MKKRGGKKRNLWLVVLILIGLFLFLSFLGIFFGTGVGGNVAYIPIKGTIVVDAEPATLFAAEAASSEKIVNYIEEAGQDPLIKAILLDINSPGGSAVASDEIGQAIKRADKLTVAVIHDVGASGGYWVASAADKIVANRMSVVGSIGVISSYLEFAKLLEEYNVTYQRLVAGKYKDMGTPFKELEEEERLILQSKIDKIHDYFIDEIAFNRGLDRAMVAEMATGEIFLGIEAKEMGLVDMLGDRRDAEEALKGQLDLEEVNYVYYRTRPSLWETLGGVSSEFFYYIGMGMGRSLFDTSENLGIRV